MGYTVYCLIYCVQAQTPSAAKSPKVVAKKKESSDSSSSEEEAPTSKASKKKQAETKKPSKSPAVTKVQSKIAKVTIKPADEESSSEDTSDEEPVKPVGKVIQLLKLLHKGSSRTIWQIGFLQ